MQLPRLGRSRSVEFNVTPLIDVVFLLIVFFLVSSHLARQETQLELDLPTAASGREPATNTLARVTINILPEGRILLGSNEVDDTEITERLRFERQKTDEKLEVRIRADRRVQYQFVEPVLWACSQAQIWNVSFAVVDTWD